MIVVTGATGKLGHHVIEGLLKQVPANQIIAAVRTPEKAKDLSDLGIQVREADYSRPETLTSAFAGATKVLLISSNEVGQRTLQHRAVIDAARVAGVALLAYTSILHADTSPLELAAEHKATEEDIRASGLPFALLRNGWYFENQTEALAPALAHGTIIGASGEGRFSSASRADYADAAVAVLTGEGHENKVYELAGDESFSQSELAAEVSRQAAKPVAYQNLSTEEYAKALVGFGLPAPFADILADSQEKAGLGELEDNSHQLSSLIGHPTQSLSSAVTAALSHIQ